MIKFPQETVMIDDIKDILRIKECNIRDSSNKEWDFLHSLKICVRIKLKVTTIIEQHFSNSKIEPMFL